MRFVSFSLGGFPLYGQVEGESVALPSRAYAAAHPTLKSAISANALGDFAADPDGRPLPLAGLSFDPVIPDPGKILCAGRNYRAHGDDAGKPEHPPIFIRFADTQIGHDAPLVLPADTTDFQLEGNWRQSSAEAAATFRSRARSRMLPDIAATTMPAPATGRATRRNTLPARTFPAQAPADRSW